MKKRRIINEGIGRYKKVKGQKRHKGLKGHKGLKTIMSFWSFMSFETLLFFNFPGGGSIMDLQAKQMECPCCSGKPYANCCQKYHKGVIPENALALMGSRYSAYALGLAAYLIQTTHPQSPHVVKDQKQWLNQIMAFSRTVSFDGLEILKTEQLGSESFVTFVAHLSKEGADLTFTERSRFIYDGNVLKYLDGTIAKGKLLS